MIPFDRFVTSSRVVCLQWDRLVSFGTRLGRVVLISTFDEAEILVSEFRRASLEWFRS